MAKRIRVCGFEGGYPRQWSQSSGAITGITTTVGAARSGNYGLRIAPSASTVNIQGTQNAPVATGYMVGRCYINFDTLPSGDCSLMSWFTGTTRYRLLFRSSDGILRMEHDTNGVQNEVQDGPVIAADTWYRFDFLFEGQSEEGGNNRRMAWKIDGVDQPEVGGNNTYLGGVTFWTLGCHANATYTLFIDDITSVDNTDSVGTAEEDAEVLAAYPLGAGAVKALRPNGVGTHNTESAFGTSAGTLADSWQLLDQDPMNGTTDYVLQSTLDTNAYLEYTFEDLAATEDPQYVQLYSGLYNNSGIAASDSRVHFIDGATDTDAIDDAAGTAVISRHNLAGFDVDPADWTVDRVNALKARWGYSSDVTPNPRCASLFYEVDWATVVETRAGSHQVEGENQLDRALWIPRPHPFLGRTNQHGAQL